ncbi:hypothetical protein [Oceanobacillus indicireducens]|uniref:Uncharacterized protein n=1 Tax=Oceanobacillus indicireducens TaxID=1004261 RepID=A0A918D325_9BACI|nr:hypothetical protein [Oceanobacillus indicireducens]GGN61382.1 hypothetical protein GCM10007971_26390 [Oceanobacillus indicireducens]
MKKNMEQLTFDSLFNQATEEAPNMGVRIQKLTQDITKFPIQLIIDFERFLKYIEHHPIQITNTKGYISSNHLPHINEQLSIKTQDETRNTQQEHYPYIHFFYLLARGGSLIKQESADFSKRYIRITERRNLFDKLTDTEKYFFLLETFWVDLNWSKFVGNNHHSIYFMLPDVISKLLDKKAGFRLQFHKQPLLANLIFHWNYFFLYFEWFGFWHSEKDQERMDHYHKNGYYFAKSIALTSFGKKMIPVLMESRDFERWNIPLRRERGEANPVPGLKLPHSEVKAGDKVNRPQLFHEAFEKLFLKRDLLNALPRLEQQ